MNVHLHKGKFFGDAEVFDEEAKKAYWGTHSKTQIYDNEEVMIGTYNIDNRSYEVSLNSVKKLFTNLNLNNYVRKSIIETYNKIKIDKAPFKRNKVTLNVYKEYLS